MRMTAAVMYEQGLPAPYAQSMPFKIEEVDLQRPGEGEVLVEVRAAGLCHSDLAQVAGERKRKVPVVGGHEGAGIIREVGDGVKSLKTGDHVVMTVATGCGHCRPCIETRPVLCETVTESRAAGALSNGAQRLSLGGKVLNHYSGISSFAQYSVTTPMSLVRIDPSVSLEVAAMLGCGVVTGAGAVFNSAKVRPGHAVAVFGLGGVGLSAVMAARICGASQIIGIDTVESKFPLARELGCTATISASEEKLVEMVMDMTGGGVNFAIEASGARPAVESANAITRRGGEIVCVGLCDVRNRYDYAHVSLVISEKVIRGSFMGGGIAQCDILQYIRFFEEGRMPLDRLRSGTIGFAELNANLDLLDHGQVTRQVLLPHG